MALLVRDGKIRNTDEKEQRKPEKVVKNRPYGIALADDFFFTAENEGDFTEYIEHLIESGFADRTVDAKFYNLMKLKKDACSAGFSLKRLKRHLDEKGKNTRNTLLTALRSYAKFRAAKGKWDLLGVMMVDDDLRMNERWI